MVDVDIKGFSDNIKHERMVNILRKLTGKIYRFSQQLTPKIRGWINYYGKERLGDMQKMFSLINRRIATWIQKKFKIKTIGQAYKRLKRIIQSFPTIFEHWKYGFTG